MKKSILFIMMGTALMLGSCKSSQSAYKQAYEKAKAQETASQVNAPVEQTAVAETPATTTAAATDNTPVRQESVSVVRMDGSLKAYSVVCGSFSVQANAEGLCQYLVSEGYKAGIVKNFDKNMYRVLVGTFDTKAEAVRAKDAFKAAYPSRSDLQEAWLLLNR